RVGEGGDAGTAGDGHRGRGKRGGSARVTAQGHRSRPLRGVGISARILALYRDGRGRNIHGGRHWRGDNDQFGHRSPGKRSDVVRNECVTVVISAVAVGHRAGRGQGFARADVRVVIGLYEIGRVARLNGA